MNHLAVKCTHFLGGKNTAALLTLQCGFLFCSQAKEERLSYPKGMGEALLKQRVGVLPAPGWAPQGCVALATAVAGGEGGRGRAWLRPGAPAPLPGSVQSGIPARPH